MTQRSTNDIEKPTIEGKHYDPEGYSNLESFGIIIKLVGVFAIIVVGLIILNINSSSESDSNSSIHENGFHNFDPKPEPSNLGNDFAIAFIAVIVIIVIIGFIGFMYNCALEKHQEKVFQAKNVEKDNLINSASSSESLLRETNNKLDKQMTQIEEIQKAQTTGDIIITNNHAPVVISSTIKNSFNTISSNDAELASAIKTLGGFIENSNNPEAAEYFNELHEHLANEEHSKITLKALWNGIVSNLPSVEKLTEVVIKITSLF